MAKGIHELLEAGEIARGVAVLEDKFNRPAALRKSREIAFGAADIAGQDHLKRSIRKRLCSASTPEISL